MPTAFLDACVLYPADYRDLLLRLAEAGAFRPLWSPEVQREWIASLLRNRNDLKPEQLERTRELMNRAFPGACVGEYDLLSLPLPDANDLHVVAAAYAGGAEYIVTENVAHFPPDALNGLELEAVRLETFLMLLVEQDLRRNGVPHTICKGLRSLRQGLGSPGKSHEELVSHWQRRGLRDFAAFAQTHKHMW